MKSQYSRRAKWTVLIVLVCLEMSNGKAVNVKRREAIRSSSGKLGSSPDFLLLLKVIYVASIL